MARVVMMLVLMAVVWRVARYSDATLPLLTFVGRRRRRHPYPEILTSETHEGPGPRNEQGEPEEGEANGAVAPDDSSTALPEWPTGAITIAADTIAREAN